MKKCSRCGLEKEDCDFYKDKTHKDGLTSVCKSCRHQVSMNWRELHREKYKSYHTKRLKSSQSFIDTLKTNCRKCGESRLYLIQFHHIDPSTKSFVIGSAGVHKSEELIKQEADKCVCLCSNCHIEYHHIYGKNPNKPKDTLLEYFGEGGL